MTAITRAMVLSAVVGAGALAMAAPTMQRSRYTVTMERLKGNLYLIEGSGMNVTALVTDDGVVLVDTMQTGWWGRAVLAKIRSVTDKPISTVIFTHSHADHIGNEGVLGTALVDVTMQERTKFHIEQAGVPSAERWAPRGAATFADKTSLVRGRDRIDLYYFGAAHTDGDAWVVFPSLQTMSIGDLAYRNDAPSFDRSAGGSGVAYPDTLARGLAALTDVDTIIVGHGYDGVGHVISRAELQRHQRLGAQMLAETRRSVQAGRSASETAASISASDDFKGFHRDKVSNAVSAIYDELTEAYLSASAPRP